jgi:hypothetical protein
LKLRLLIIQILDNCEPPYSFLQSNYEVMEYVSSGKRIPKQPDCPDKLYKIMVDCWNDNPNARPSFLEVLELLSALKEQETEESNDKNSNSVNNYYKVASEVDYSHDVYKKENSYDQ